MNASKPSAAIVAAPINANNSELLKTRVDAKSVRVMSESDNSKKAIGKADARYWQQKGKLLTDKRSRFFSCKIQVRGRRESFPLRTANKNAAASKASLIYGDVIALGWDAAIAKHKPDERPVKGSTVGDLVRVASELADVRAATLTANVQAFRRIVAGIHGIEMTAKRYARKGEGKAAWIAAIDAIPLEKVTPAMVEAWKKAYVTAHSEGSETKARSARNTVNASLRAAKSLFSKSLLRFLPERLTLPPTLPFSGVEFYERQSMRYTSTMDVRALLNAAGAELATNDTEAYKAFLLCLFAGLRRNEADKLQWRSIDFIQGVIRIEAHASFAPKAETSLDEVPLEPEVSQILRGLRAREPKAIFVLNGVAPRTGLKWRPYRAEATFKRLLAWLRAHGVDARTPMHTLRKEAGSLVCKQAGVFTASRFLRHADVAITAQHYVDQKDRVTVGLGSLLTSTQNVVPFVPVESNASSQASNAHEAHVKSA